ncbi:LytR/AlgR family response regulator transcription factor [Hymenobacter chitinivorans]|uniref:DNA-binding LytR/AlgR family response regulator n=1 Tax=Hymenobacter chitinivorans DSM 11115 TaxID=1121954 RepID=A0A2M9BQC5_9BACT|nr:LytTR family DNA-binding domain-containing protein [Hymenobacter chitinivorans]PJJ60164.1 DNA-binding LytR/AlgR family response regulator [Hymenobacter chitinivorans DSM 11115]
MRIVVVEDEARIARRLERMTRAYFGPQLQHLVTCDSVTQARQVLETTAPDLVLLDLNLNGQDGFSLLESAAAGAFHTIIISAYTDKAITAFAYGVLDFVPKPFGEERLFQAFARLSTAEKKPDGGLQFLAVKKHGDIVLLDIRELRYIKGAGIYSELHLQNGKKELHDKSLEKLAQLLPASFERIHKSYIVPIAQAERILVQEGSRYQLQLKDGELLPIGRSRYKELKAKLI